MPDLRPSQLPQPTLVPHMAVLSGDHARNSRDAILECFEANVERIEIDVHSLNGPDYAVFHDRRLETQTSGRGSIGAATPDDLRRAEFARRPGERPPLLSEVVEMARGRDTQIQLDLKDWRPLPRERLRALIDTVAPIKERVILSSGQDWNLLRFHREDPTLPFGFDPGHYLDHRTEGSPFFLPQKLGAYGYRDDHPLAIGRTEDTVDYLRQRVDMLVLQAPAAREFFLSYRLVLHMLDDGFDIVAALAERRIESNVWTVDYAGPESLLVLARLAAAGIRRVTTNTTNAWGAALSDRRD